jgi:hypothetical protein
LVTNMSLQAAKGRQQNSPGRKPDVGIKLRMSLEWAIDPIPPMTSRQYGIFNRHGQQAIRTMRAWNLSLEQI